MLQKSGAETVPIYLFRCESCDITSEKKMTMLESGQNEPSCDKCGQNMKRIYTPPGIQIN